MFTLVVDDFGVKYVGKQQANNLINALQNLYKITVDWARRTYLGMSFRWNYKKVWVDI